MKKVGYVLYIILFVICFHFSVRFFLNEIGIHRYHNYNFDNGIVNYLMILNYPEPYIVHYNKGNNLYQEGKYEEAIEEFSEAMKTVKGDRKCKVEINLALSKIKLVNFDDAKTAIKELKEIQKILLEDNCATEDNNGKDEESQELYNELEKKKEETKEKNGDNNDDNKDDDENEDEQDSDEQKQKEKELEDKLKEQQEQSSNERNKVDQRDYQYYDGKKW